ncbi:MAG: FadR/GntR family transcriptional regulator [Anaerobutyricum soehngenii]
MKNQKTYQYVFDYFSEQILSGELKINDKILPEREIAEKLDVSRNSIREVMHMLEINGLLDCRQGSGNYLRCEPQDYMVKFMNMVMSLQQIKYTEVYDIRMGYETSSVTV